MDERLVLWTTLERLGVRAPTTMEWPDIWFETTKPIGGSYQGEGRPFGVTWEAGDAYAGGNDDFPSWREDVTRSFGLTPHSRIRLAAGCVVRPTT